MTDPPPPPPAAAASMSPAMDIPPDESLGMVDPASSLAPPVPLPNPDSAAATVAALFLASSVGGNALAPPYPDA